MMSTSCSASSLSNRSFCLARTLCLLLILAGGVEAQTNDISYVYDELGRVVAVVDPAGDTVTYGYDANGNVLSISRQSSSIISIIRFTPSSGAVGTTVTIYGTAFSTTASQNTVSFNGTTATITSATATRIVTTVPSGATTGTITVTSPAGSATSSSSFTVGASTAPTITSFTPTIGTAGTSVTITGTNFETATAGNKVKLNVTRSLVNSSTATSIGMSVPTAAGSGRISVATQSGSAVSSGDFYVPPSPYAATDIGYTGRMALGGSATATISTAGKKGMMLFDGTAGQRISLNMSSVSIGSSYCCSTFVSVIKPDGTRLVSPFYVGLSGGFLDTITLPATGTYTIFINPESSGTGSMTLTLYNVPADVSASITPGGSAVTVSPATPGQNARLTFSGTAAQRVSLNMTSVSIGSSYCCSTFVSIIKPDGTTLVSPAYVGLSGGYIDTTTLPVTGTYTILVDPQSTSTGSITLSLYDVPADITGTITPGGSTVTVSPATPGQNARPTFSGTSGQRISLDMTSVSIGSSYCCSTFVSVLKPDGTTLISPFYVGLAGLFMDTVTLPVTGTYTLLVDPQSTGTGSMTLTLYDVPADASASITLGGSAVTISNGTPGQNGGLSFSGTSGQRISLNMSGVSMGTSYCCSTMVSILKPDGSALLSPSYIGLAGGYFDTVTLSATGTYTIFVNPQGNGTGSMTQTLNNVPADATGSVTIGGSAVSAATTVSGQNALLTFSGTASQQVTVHVTSNTIAAVTVSLLKPDGTSLTSYTTYSSTGSFNLTTQTLPTTGTYTIRIDPGGANTGSMSVNVTNP